MADRGRIPHGNDCGERRALNGEVCGCIRAPGHVEAGERMHECSCGKRWGTIRVVQVLDA